MAKEGLSNPELGSEEVHISSPLDSLELDDSSDSLSVCSPSSWERRVVGVSTVSGGTKDNRANPLSFNLALSSSTKAMESSEGSAGSGGGAGRRGGPLVEGGFDSVDAGEGGAAEI